MHEVLLNGWLYMRQSTNRRRHYCFHKFGVSACWFFLYRQVKTRTQFYLEDHFPNYIINGTWYNTTIFSQINCSSFEEFLQMQEKTGLI